MAASFRMKRPTPHCRQRDVQVLVSVDISITKDKIPDSEAMHFLPRNLAGTSSPMVGWQPCRRPPTTCSRRTYRRPLTWCGGVCKRNSDQPLLLQAGISRRVVEANRPALFRLFSEYMLDERPKSIRKMFVKNTLLLRGPTQIYMNPSL